MEERDMANIDEIEARLAKATPGPWLVAYDANDPMNAAIPFNFVVATAESGPIAEEMCGDDARFIAHAPADIAALIAEVRRCHARLEIDHVWRPARDGETPERDGLVREPIPYERRASEPDGIECRDATIAMLQGRLAWSQAENARLREAMPTPNEMDRFRQAMGCLPYGANDAYCTMRAALARLDAARKGGG